MQSKTVKKSVVLMTLGFHCWYQSDVREIGLVSDFIDNHIDVSKHY